MDIAGSLTQKIGPLPAWAYGVGLGGVVLVVRFMRDRGAADTEAETSSTSGSAYPLPTSSGDNNGYGYPAGSDGLYYPPLPVRPAEDDRLNDRLENIVDILDDVRSSIGTMPNPGPTAGPIIVNVPAPGPTPAPTTQTPVLTKPIFTVAQVRAEIAKVRAGKRDISLLATMWHDHGLPDSLRLEIDQTLIWARNRNKK